MDKQSLKYFIVNQLKRLFRPVVTTIILTLVAIATVYVYAAFTEPTAGPNDSDQDFAQNILGANNADNDFDSSLVAANKDGSIIERAEYIVDRMTTAGEWYSLECNDSTTTATSTCYVDDTAKYVDTNACSASSNTGYCFMNTATFSAKDGDLAAGNIVSGKTIFGVAGSLTSAGSSVCDRFVYPKECTGTLAGSKTTCTQEECHKWCEQKSTIGCCIHNNAGGWCYWYTGTGIGVGSNTRAAVCSQW